MCNMFILKQHKIQHLYILKLTEHKNLIYFRNEIIIFCLCLNKIMS